MSDIYSDWKISDSSRDRAEVNIVDADDGASDEAEFGDVGEDNVGEDIILLVVFYDVSDWCGRSPLNVRAIARGERGLRRRGTGDRDGMAF